MAHYQSVNIFCIAISRRKCFAYRHMDYSPALIASANRILAQLKMPPKLSVSEWADKYRYLSSESSARPGKWRSLPFQREPMDAIHDPMCRGVVLMWAAQLHGKTEICNNLIGYTVSENPAPILILQPTIDTAKNWSKTRLAPMVRDTPRIANLIAEAKSRDTDNTLFEKQFPGGHLKIVGANAPSGLASTPIKILICDEVDRYPESAGTEGDPVSLAEARTGNFWDSFTLKTSTPTVKGESKIEEEWFKTDQRYWFVECPRCNHSYALRWEHVRWEKGKEDDAWMECPSCQAHLTDTERREMISLGTWKATADYHGIRGYHLNGLYHMFPAKRGFKSRLHQAVLEFQEANRAGNETLKTWINTFLAETWEEPTFRISSTELGKRAEKYAAELPAGVLCLVATVDTQADRLEYQLVGFGEGEEAWAIDYRAIYGNPHLLKVWQDLDVHLGRYYQHELGHKLRAHICFIDSGGQAYKAGFNTPVYRFVKPRQMGGLAGGVWACRGAGQLGAQLRREFVQFKTKHNRGIRLQLVGTDESKSLFYSRLQIEEPGPRYIHFPDTEAFNDEYFRQCTAEEVKKHKRHGREVRTWQKIRERNEALDLWAYTFAALDKLNPDWSALAAKSGRPSQQKRETPEPAPGGKIPMSAPRSAPHRMLRRLPPRRGFMHRH